MEGGKKTWDKEKRELKEGEASFNLVEQFSFNHYSTLTFKRDNSCVILQELMGDKFLVKFGKNFYRCSKFLDTINQSKPQDCKRYLSPTGT